MPVERPVTVVRVEPQWLWLSLDGACQGCGGCRGRCDLSRRLLSASARGQAGSELADQPLRLPRRLAPGDWAVEQRAALQLEEEAWLVEAGRAYGFPLLGLLLGAGIGRWLLAEHALMNAGVLCAATMGTLGALWLSKRYSAQPLEGGLRLLRRPD